MLPGIDSSYVPAPSERTSRNSVNRLDFNNGRFTLNGAIVEVKPTSMALRVGCHLVSYAALRRMFTLVKRQGPIEALDE